MFRCVRFSPNNETRHPFVVLQVRAKRLQLAFIKPAEWLPVKRVSLRKILCTNTISTDESLYCILYTNAKFEMSSVR